MRSLITPRPESCAESLPGSERPRNAEIESSSAAGDLGIARERCAHQNGAIENVTFGTRPVARGRGLVLLGVDLADDEMRTVAAQRRGNLRPQRACIGGTMDMRRIPAGRKRQTIEIETEGGRRRLEAVGGAP